MVGNNSAGMRSIVYGTTADQVLSLRCVLASGETVELRSLPREEAKRRASHADAASRLLRGALEIGERYADEIKRRFPRMIRRVSGYGLDALVDPETVDLTRLVCGSEGTLAVVTRADFRLAELPPRRGLASLEFDTLAAAARATVELLKLGPRLWSCSTTWPSAGRGLRPPTPAPPASSRATRRPSCSSSGAVRGRSWTNGLPGSRR